MRATLHQLKVFRQLASSMNYTEAANQLSLTQPAVSIQIKQLEDNLGIPLLEKIGNKLFLTTAGQELNRFCIDLFERIDLMDMTLSAMRGNLEGEFSLAAVTSAKYFTPHLLGAFHKLYPNVNLRLEVANRHQIIQRLKNNNDDLVIMGLVPESMPLTCHPFVDNPIVIIASPSHPLARQKNIMLTELQAHPFIFREAGSGTRKALERFLQSQQVSLSSGMVLGSTETIKQAVMADLGISAVSRHSITLELATKCLVELDIQHFPLLRSWYVVHHEKKQLSPIARAFIDFILNQQDQVNDLCNRFLKNNFIESLFKI
jgi:DNA-binding transcriptional LysR family regulator